MDSVMLVLTFVSLATAAGFGVVTFRVMREERQRSEARVAGLSDAIDAGTRSEVLGPRYAETAEAHATMFGRATEAVAGGPMLKAAVIGVMAIVLIVAVAMSGGKRSAAPAAAARADATPLELMSMRSARTGNTLTVTGLVHNPSSGAEARHVDAVILAFNAAGAFVGSGRAPLDFLVLDPDDESPFTVTVPNASDVARYRVSFRTEAGVVRHINRRSDTSQLARNQ